MTRNQCYVCVGLIHTPVQSIFPLQRQAMAHSNNNTTTNHAMHARCNFHIALAILQPLQWYALCNMWHAVTTCDLDQGHSQNKYKHSANKKWLYPERKYALTRHLFPGPTTKPCKYNEYIKFCILAGELQLIVVSIHLLLSIFMWTFLCCIYFFNFFLLHATEWCSLEIINNRDGRRECFQFLHVGFCHLSILDSAVCTYCLFCEIHCFFQIV